MVVVEFRGTCNVRLQAACSLTYKVAFIDLGLVGYIYVTDRPSNGHLKFVATVQDIDLDDPQSFCHTPRSTRVTQRPLGRSRWYLCRFRARLGCIFAAFQAFLGAAAPEKIATTLPPLFCTLHGWFRGWRLHVDFEVGSSNARCSSRSNEVSCRTGNRMEESKTQNNETAVDDRGAALKIRSRESQTPDKPRRRYTKLSTEAKRQADSIQLYMNRKCEYEKQDSKRGTKIKSRWGVSFQGAAEE